VGQILAKEQYIKRYDGVCALLHYHIYKDIAVKLGNKHWHDHVPKSVETGQDGKITILWNQQVRTDRTIPNNKPDIIIRGNKQGTCTLIIAVKAMCVKIGAYKPYRHVRNVWCVQSGACCTHYHIQTLLPI